MKIIDSIVEMQGVADSLRGLGKRIALVPTMGYFHEGHLNLMRIGRTLGDYLAVSLYVNPTQFAPTEDFEAYPRDFERDRKMAEEVGVDAIFCPDSTQMYPEGYQTYVSVMETTKNLCGRSRPHFFRGVTTVCTKLFHSVKPHVAVFGKKDYQQYVTICRMVRDLDMGIEIVGAPITREPSGLAMSSRNVYLRPEEMESALSLSRSLVEAKGMYEKGERESRVILDRVRGIIERHPHAKIDYAQICHAATMDDIPVIGEQAVLALAVWVGKTRLIDNHVFGEPLDIDHEDSNRGGR
ncbi:MAG: pantoate--beta-alanine ligase [Deltaproteobacteria bacterium]|nr:pantoate--beta-alanine ligase [Deltaproteobacteria bacterium]